MTDTPEDAAQAFKDGRWDECGAYCVGAGKWIIAPKDGQTLAEAVAEETSTRIGEVAMSSSR